MGVVPRVGFEPTTVSLRGSCSTVELTRLNLQYYTTKNNLQQKKEGGLIIYQTTLLFDP